MHYTETIYPTGAASVEAEAVSEIDLFDGLTLPPPPAGLPLPEWEARLRVQLQDLMRKPASSFTRLKRLEGLLAEVHGLFKAQAHCAYVCRAASVDPFGAEVAGNVRAASSRVGQRAAMRDTGAQAAAFLNAWFSEFYAGAGRLLGHEILPALAQGGVRIRRLEQLGADQIHAARTRFLRELYPLLTPWAVDSGRPFPNLTEETPSVLVTLQSPEQAARRSPLTLYACVSMPSKRASLLDLSDVLVWSVDLARTFAHELFPGMHVREAHLFRVVRVPAPVYGDDSGDSQAAVESRADSIARKGEGGQGGLRPRTARRQPVVPIVSLQVEASMPDAVVAWLVKQTQAEPHAVARVAHALELFGLAGLAQAAAARSSTNWSQASVQPRIPPTEPASRTWVIQSVTP